MKTSKQVLIFLHIPKTAGSTFHNVLGKRYSSRETCNVFGSRYSEPEIERFINGSRESKEHIRLLKGHMPFGLHNSMPDPGACRYISVLRNPIDRVISQYYYIKKNSYNPLHDAVERGGMSIKEFVSSGISVGMNNGHCRFLNGDLDQFPFNEGGEDLYERAVKNIENHFIWLGLTERFDESILLLSKQLNWKFWPNYLRENVSKVRKPISDIDASDIDEIRKYNEFDVKLYEYAERRLDSAISEYENFSDELAQFRAKNNSLQKSWSWLPSRFRKWVV